MVPFGSINSLTPFVSYLSTKGQPGTTIAMADIAQIGINNGVNVYFSSNGHTPGNTSQGFQWDSLDAPTYITPVVTEMAAYLQNPPLNP